MSRCVKHIYNYCKKNKEKRNGSFCKKLLFLSVYGLKKDIFGRFAYEFELLPFLVKSFASLTVKSKVYAFGEIFC